MRQGGLYLAAAGSGVLALLVLARLAGLVAAGQRVQDERRRLLERLIRVSEEERPGSPSRSTTGRSRSSPRSTSSWSGSGACWSAASWTVA